MSPKKKPNVEHDLKCVYTCVYQYYVTFTMFSQPEMIIKQNLTKTSGYILKLLDIY